MNHIVKELQNGIEVNIFPLEEVKTLSVGIYIKGAGSSKDPKSKMGLHELLSGLIMRGTKSFPSYTDLNFEIESLGGSVNVNSSSEYFAYAMSVPSRESKKGLEVLLDLYLNPLLKEKDLRKEKVNQETNIRAKTNDPVSFANSKFLENIYKGNPIANDTLGTIETLSNINLEDLWKAQKAVIKQKPMIVIMGSFNIEEILNILNESIGQLKLSKNEWKFPEFKERVSNDRLQLLNRDLGQVNLFYGQLFPGRTYQDFQVISIARAILGSGFGSLAHQKIRDEMKLAYAASASIDVSAHVSTIYIYAGINKMHLEAVVEESRKLFEDLAKGNIKKNDLKRAQNFLIGATMVRSESVGNKAALQASYLLYENKPISFEEMRERVLSVTIEDIQKLFANLESKNHYLTVIGANKANKEKLFKLI